MYIDDEFVEDLNYIDGKHKADLFRQGLLDSYDGEVWPTLEDPNAANAYNRFEPAAAAASTSVVGLTVSVCLTSHQSNYIPLPGWSERFLSQ